MSMSSTIIRVRPLQEPNPFPHLEVERDAMENGREFGSVRTYPIGRENRWDVLPA